MGVFVPAVNGLEVAMEYTDFTGDQNINVHWVQNSAPWTAASIKTMLDAFITWFSTGDGTNFPKACMSSAAQLVSLNGRDNTTQHGLVVVDQSGLPIAGTGGSTAIQAGTTKAITWRTGFAGKSYRGRSFLPAIPTGGADTPESGKMLGGFMTIVIDAYLPLIAAVTAAIGTCKLVVCSRYYQPGGPLTPTVPRATAVMTPILSVGYSDLNVDFQRRRAPGHARHH